jgi:hypothetical protein
MSAVGRVGALGNHGEAGRPRSAKAHRSAAFGGRPRLGTPERPGDASDEAPHAEPGVLPGALGIIGHGGESTNAPASRQPQDRAWTRARRGKTIPVVRSIAIRQLTLAFVVLAAGCAWQSEVVKIGQDTYQTTAIGQEPYHMSANDPPAPCRERGREPSARRMALAHANKKCDSMGKQIEVISSDIEWGFPLNSVVTVTFKCK